MNLADAFRMELQHEAAGTRKALERVPEDKFGWKPHDKSMSAGRLAGHLGEIPGWLGMIVGQDVLDFDPAQFTPFEPKSRKELLQYFDDNLKAGLDALNGVPDSKMMVNWKMKTPEATIVDMPRAMVIRAWVLSHLIHHRAQLTVYLRMLGAPVPSLYGPSADEQG